MFKILALLISITHFSHGEFNLATGLTESNRQLVLKTLGLGTLSKNTSRALPLGTDSGLEISLTTEVINTKRIAPFIVEEKNQDYILYPKFSIGKGIFNKLDVYFHFIPYTKTLGLSEFGGLFRYNFFHSESSPLTTSILLHANSANFNNQLISRNIGSDLLFGMNWETFSLSSSFGWGSSSGRFIGGTQGVTDSLIDEYEDVDSFHFAVATHFKYKIWVLSASMDHYTRPVYSIKIGALL